MLLDPALGYYDEGLDLTEADLYRQARGPFGSARTLPPASYRSKIFSSLEDNRVWARSWVAVGVERQIPAPGDLLPFTIGYHGVHLQREPDGSIAGRFNKAQHGGCRSVPLQCQTGSRTRCSFTSCGYSRDRDVVPVDELASDGSVANQYLGMIPERLLPVRVETWGPLLFVCLDPRGSSLEGQLAALGPARAWPAGAGELTATRWLEAKANWKLIGPALRDRLAPEGSEMPPQREAGVPTAIAEQWTLGEAAPGLRELRRAAEDKLSLLWCFPNLLMVRLGGETLLVILQPLSMEETQLRVLLMAGSGGGEERLEAWLGLLREAMGRAAREQETLSAWGTPKSPETRDRPAPRQRNALAWAFQDYLIGRILEED